METNRNQTPEKYQIARPEAKFFLGFFAGICSAIFPRLIVALNMSGISSDIMIADIVVFDLSYIICGLIFSIIVGIVVMILEWNVFNEPGKTFMMALSIPALLAGSFNTNSAIDLYKDQASLQILEDMQRENPIPIIHAPAKKIIPLAEADDKRPTKKSHVFSLPGTTKAYAADSYENSYKLLAFKVREQHYVIVLNRAPDRQGAIQRARQLSTAIQEAKAVQVANQYYVVLGDIRLPRSEALQRADQLRRHHSNLGLNIELMPVESH